MAGILYKILSCGSSHNENIEQKIDGTGGIDNTVNTVVSKATKDLDLEYWMTDLPPSLKEVPVIYLAIPGSHDSMVYNISKSSELAPDAETAIKYVWRLFPGTVVRWSKTQMVDVTQQLTIGIRYFDLRIATKPKTDQLFFTHGLYGDEISGAFKEMKLFLDSHSEEVVIMDCQHFYGFTHRDHQRLSQILINAFGTKICDRTSNLEAVSLARMHRLSQQVIIIYRHPFAYSSNHFWLGELWPTPWPRKHEVQGLSDFLFNLKRKPGSGFVHQAVLTPTLSFILKRLFMSLKTCCAEPVLREVIPELEKLSPGRPSLQATTVNVVIADFVEMSQAAYPRAIVKLNYKLLASRQYSRSPSDINPYLNSQY